VRRRQMRAENSPEKRHRGCEVTAAEAEVLKLVFETLLKSGRAPTPDEMAASLEKSPDNVLRTLDQLEGRDLLVREEGTQQVISAYPFSVLPTEHQVFVEDGPRLFAMCALDAVAMPVMCNRNARIVSQCEQCKTEISIDIRDDSIVSASHPDIIIWSPKERGTCAAVAWQG
jgi:hypothetical protein